MGVETWYRGEGANVPPSKPGGNLHDFGDGLYLTDSEDVGWQYAKTRAPQPEELRLWEVTVDRSTLGSVLDLSADARWGKFMGEPIAPGSSNPTLQKSRLFFLKTQNELYGQFFQEFLKANKIDVNTYDAVIGPEYVRGGRQICLLNKGGAPSGLQQRIRSLMRPNAWAKRLTKILKGGATAPPEEGILPPKSTLPRAIGGLIISIGLNVLLAYISSKIMQKINDSIIRQSLALIEPEMQKYKSARMIMILDNLADGEKAFLFSEMTYEYSHAPSGDTQNPSYLDSPPSVHLAALSIISRDLSSVTHSIDTSFLSGGLWSDVYTVKSSAEVQVSKEVISQYQEIKKQLKWYDDTLKARGLLEADRKRLVSERSELERWIEKAYGKFSDFVPTPALWTTDGYAQITGT